MTVIGRGQGEESQMGGRKASQLVAQEDAKRVGLLADDNVQEVFSFVLAKLACFDDEIAPALRISEERVVAIIGSLKEVGLVEISHSLIRDEQRIVRLTRDGIRLARRLRNL